MAKSQDNSAITLLGLRGCNAKGWCYLWWDNRFFSKDSWSWHL